MHAEVVTIDVAAAGDENFLWLMLTYAATVGSGGIDQIPAAKADTYLRSYVDGWATRRGDLGVIARSNTGQPLGAAWLRLGESGGSFKLSDQNVPELATAVVPSARGKGVGTKLLTALVAHARPHYKHIILSVRDNSRAARFYERLGWREIRRMQNRVGGESLVMLLDL